MGNQKKQRRLAASLLGGGGFVVNTYELLSLMINSGLFLITLVGVITNIVIATRKK
jgi:hypothetical protein